MLTYHRILLWKSCLFLFRQVLILGVYASHSFGFLRVKNDVFFYFFFNGKTALLELTLYLSHSLQLKAFYQQEQRSREIVSSGIILL